MDRIMQRDKIALALLLACGLFEAGCDPVQTTSQLVKIQVVDAATRKPVPDATVSIVYAEISGDRSAKDVRPTPQEWKNRTAGGPGVEFCGVTDRQGIAAIDVRYTSIDRNSGPTPPHGRNLVTAHTYLIKLADSNGHEQIGRLVMEPGASVVCKSFAANVLGIAQPQYVATK
jgi:hypothetical protein